MMDYPDPRLEVADAFLMAGELADALEALDSYLTEHPDDGDIRRLRAAVLLRMPGEDAAWAALDDLAAMRARTAEDEIARVRALRRLGENVAAHEALYDAYERTGDFRLAELLLASLHSRGEVDEGHAVLDTLPETAVWLRWRGEFALLGDEPQAAVTAFSAALDRLSAVQQSPFIQNERGQLLLRRAEAYERRGDRDSAHADRSEAKRLLPAER